jgi:uncharacterized protein with HEPN domain
MTYEAFTADRKTVDAVIRNLIVIGEAAGRVPDDVALVHPEIPWKDMRDMRNLVIHEYFGVSEKSYGILCKGILRRCSCF